MKNTIKNLFIVITFAIIMIASIEIVAFAAEEKTLTCPADSGTLEAELCKVYPSGIKWSETETTECKYSTSIDVNGVQKTVYLNTKPSTSNLGVQMNDKGGLEIEGIEDIEGIGSSDNKYDSDGLYVSENGYWVTDGEETNFKAFGISYINEFGEVVIITLDGNVIKVGKLDSNTNLNPIITISNDGYFIVNDVKTEYKAFEQNSGNSTIEISADGYWIINGVKTGYKVSTSDVSTDTSANNESDMLKMMLVITIVAILLIIIIKLSLLHLINKKKEKTSTRS